MLLGRDRERAVIDSLLDDARSGASRVLVVRGEPGIGKSALLAYALERAGDARVLRGIGVEAEGELPFAALHQVLWPVLDRLDAIPPPQAAALRGAFGLTHDRIDDRFLVSLATLSLLAEVASDGPVLCVVDDAHWLDGASADALGFAARRVEADPIALLFGARDGDVREFHGPGLPELRLGGLEPGAAGALLAARSERPLEPSVRDALVRATHGNPLALIELPGALGDDVLSGARPLDAELPLVAGVERAFLERVHRMSAAGQVLLLVIACDEGGGLGAVLAAAEALGVGAGTVDEAERARLIDVSGRNVAFRHPLVRSAVYHSATFGQRRAAHEALAAVLVDDADRDRRAWHLAAAAPGPVGPVADELELCAGLALERGGFAAAAAALERAGELSTNPIARGRRIVAAARAAERAGRPVRAGALLERARPLLRDNGLQAEHAAIVGDIELATGRPGAAFPALMAAAEQVAGTDPGRALALVQSALEAAVIGGGVADVRRAVDTGATITPAPGDEPQAFASSMLTGLSRLHAGDPAAGVPLLERALAHAAVMDDGRSLMWAAGAAMHLGDDRRPLALLERAIAVSRARGALSLLPHALGMRAVQLMRSGRYADALVAADEALRLARDTGSENHAPLPQGVLAFVAALEGRDEDCEREAGEALALALRRELALAAGVAASALMQLDLARGRWAEALRRIEEIMEGRRGLGDPLMRILLAPSRVEAAVGAGAAGPSEAWIDAYEDWAVHARVSWAMPVVAACRGLVADGDEAGEHFERALEAAGATRPIDRAKIHLWYGEHLRRRRRRVEAREHLRAASETFEQIGARPWRERAERELRASGETLRKRDVSPLAELTPRELQIGRLAAEGTTNREIAAQLFLSSKTIEYHLHNLFAKLGIASRAELIRLRLEDRDALAEPV